MQTERLMDNVMIMPGGKIKLPQAIQDVLGVSDGHRITFIAEGDEVRIVNPFIHALRELQKGMEGAAERAGLYTEDDVVALVKEVRAELAQE